MKHSFIDPPKEDLIILIGTVNGLYRSLIDDIDIAHKMLDCGLVPRIRHYDDEIFAATPSGLFRSLDRAKTWINLGVPREEVWSVLKSPDGEFLYAGTHPSHLYISDYSERSWRELESLQELPSRDSWHLPRHRNASHVRSLIAHPDAPDRVIAGIEVGGVHVSEDRGKTWIERRNGIHDDIHHLLALGADEYIASTGGGLYRTYDAGHSWQRLDEELDHTYFRETFVAGGTLYASAARSSPPHWKGEKGTDGALFESTDGGETFESVSYPGQPQEFVLAWASPNDNEEDVIAGTNKGRILRRVDTKWSEIGSIPSPVHALEVI